MYPNLSAFTCFLQLVMRYHCVEGDPLDEAMHYAYIAFDNSPIAHLLLPLNS